MENKEQLPWDLIEEILSRVPPKFLVRFGIVSKQWNRLFNDKTFINNHKTTFRFILRTKSKLYSVSINPKIEVRELTLDIPGLESQIPYKLVDCNGLLLCGMGKGAVVWNPWLGQTTWIEPEVNKPILHYSALGYDNDKRYKTLASRRTELDPPKTIWEIYDFSSHSWKNASSNSSSSTSTQKLTSVYFLTDRGVSLDGFWYRAASYDDTSLLSLVKTDFSSGNFYAFCDLPCVRNTGQDALALSVFRGDRFSFLKQCHLTKKIEVWVTKNKIDKYRGQDVEWVSFMEALVPDLPDLVQIGTYSQPSYFIEDKRLVVCSGDENGRAWIYVLGDNKLIMKKQIELVVDPWLLHCSLIPSLAPVPRGQREEAKLQV